MEHVSQFLRADAAVPYMIFVGLAACKRDCMLRDLISDGWMQHLFLIQQLEADVRMSRVGRMVTIAKNLNSTIKLNDGLEMPMFGLGMWQAKSGRGGLAEKAVICALQNGYKMIDTATLYQ